MVNNVQHILKGASDPPAPPNSLGEKRIEKKRLKTTVLGYLKIRIGNHRPKD